MQPLNTYLFISLFPTGLMPPSQGHTLLTVCLPPQRIKSLPLRIKNSQIWIWLLPPSLLPISSLTPPISSPLLLPLSSPPPPPISSPPLLPVSSPLLPFSSPLLDFGAIFMPGNLIYSGTCILHNPKGPNFSHINKSFP